METTSDKPTGELVLKGISKLGVSPQWVPAERESLIQLLRSEKTRLEEYEKEMRKTCQWEAPYFAENKAKRKQIEEMIFFLGIFSSRQLELNRANFSDYIE